MKKRLLSLLLVLAIEIACFPFVSFASEVNEPDPSVQASSYEALELSGGMLNTSSLLSDTSTNLLNNPSFKLNLTGWSLGSGGGIVETVSTDSFSGVKSLHIKQTTTSEKNVYVLQDIPASAAEVYSLSCMAKQITGSSVELYLDFLDSAKQRISVYTKKLPVSTTWQPVQIYNKMAPNSTAYVRIWIWANIPTAIGTEAFVDDIKLSTGVLANSSFEQDLASWSYGNDGGIVETVTTDSFSGVKSLHIKRTTTSGSAYVFQDILATAAEVYSLSCMAKQITGSSVEVYLDFLNSAKQRISVYSARFPISSTWQSVKIENKIAPTNTAYVRIWVWTVNPPTIGTETFVDDIKLSTGLLANSSFEQDLASWSYGNDGGIVETVTTDSFSGVKSLHIKRTTTSGSAYVFQDIPATAAEVYSLSCMAKQITGSSVEVYLDFLNSAKQRISVYSARFPISSTWQSVRIENKIAPTNTAYVRIWVWTVNPPIVGTETFVDLLQLTNIQVSNKSLYDNMNRLNTIYLPTKTINYQYDSNGNLIKRTIN
ncbi:hypothetical protein [Desulforamulus aeronauticus]|uniref:Carbohydrate binding domain-containing protein n=1 Tax=Desulforamulus aeronauticus DSM 10349 TaxID=1121421 RepID=A0A1M6RYB7_9FIRM|nr:hypothetical protein [Desulforamulus aeronauticus]SHK37484.1 hypothetical protein SAMN02745123_01625 [Desulforamulus aeronauticus DSM 10349]